MTWQPLLDHLTKLRDSWPAPPWTWDARFNAVASTFDTTQEAAVRTSAMLAFPRGWTTKSLDAAPAEMRALVERVGGLRPRQRVLAGEPRTCPTLFGLWWPWGDGSKITLRIGSLDLVPMPEVRALFGA